MVPDHVREATHQKHWHPAGNLAIRIPGQGYLSAIFILKKELRQVPFEFLIICSRIQKTLNDRLPVLL